LLYCEGSLGRGSILKNDDTSPTSLLQAC